MPGFGRVERVWLSTRYNEGEVNLSHKIRARIQIKMLEMKTTSYERWSKDIKCQGRIQNNNEGRWQQCQIYQQPLIVHSWNLKHKPSGPNKNQNIER